MKRLFLVLTLVMLVGCVESPVSIPATNDGVQDLNYVVDITYLQTDNANTTITQKSGDNFDLVIT